MANKLKYIPIETAVEIKQLFLGLAKSYLSAVRESQKEINAFGVFTDSDMSVFSFACNVIKTKTPQPEAPLDEKWWIPEWSGPIPEDFFDDDPRQTKLFSLLEELIEQTDVENEELEEEYFSGYKDDIFDLFCQVFVELRSTDLLNVNQSSFILLVQESDNGFSGNTAREASLTLLLSKAQLEEYRVFEKEWLG